MIIVDELKEGFNIMLHPKSATQKERKISEALAFYYKIIIIPLILYIILALTVPSTYAAGLLTGPFSGTHVISGILSFLVVTPIVLFVFAFLFQIFGKLFKAFSNPYSNTFTATVYGAVPSILFYWLSPVFGLLLLIIFDIWGFIITIFALANQQKTSALKAFAVIVVTVVIIIAIILLIVVGALFSLGLFSSSLMSSSTPSSTSSNICISSIGFYCNTPILHSGTLSVALGQDTGASINNVTLCFVPGTATPSSCSGYPSYYVSNWPGGQTINAAFSVSGIPTTNGELMGRIFASYGGSMQEAAAVTAKAT